jgi:hypothetical protein
MGNDVECLTIHDIIQKTGSLIEPHTEGEDCIADRSIREKAGMA